MATVLYEDKKLSHKFYISYYLSLCDALAESYWPKSSSYQNGRK